jgi:hypothetical protein
MIIAAVAAAAVAAFVFWRAPSEVVTAGEDDVPAFQQNKGDDDDRWDLSVQD